jgi:hypothetical protein
MSKECSNGLLRIAMGHNHYLFSIVVSDYLFKFFKNGFNEYETMFFYCGEFLSLGLQNH